MTVPLLLRILAGRRTLRASDFQPTFNEKTRRWRPSNLSALAQARLRNAAKLLSVQVPGLPETPQRPPIRLLPTYEHHTLRERRKLDKQAFVKQAMDKMPQTIAAWKEERRKEREKMKPKHPF